MARVLDRFETQSEAEAYYHGFINALNLFAGSGTIYRDGIWHRSCADIKLANDSVISVSIEWNENTKQYVIVQTSSTHLPL